MVDYNTISIIAASRAACKLFPPFQIRLSKILLYFSRNPSKSVSYTHLDVYKRQREYYAVVENTPANIRRQLTTTGYRSVADVYATVEAGDEYLENGLTVTSTVLIADRQQLLTIPYKAIGQDENGEYVYRIENGRALKSYIVTGQELEDAVEVQSGLELGASIVEDHSLIRSAGQLVRLKGEKAA